MIIYDEIKQVETYNYLSVFDSVVDTTVTDIKDFLELMQEIYKTENVKQINDKIKAPCFTPVLYTLDGVNCLGLNRSKENIKRWTGVMCIDLDLEKSLKVEYLNNTNAELNKEVDRVVQIIHSYFNTNFITTKTSNSGTGVHAFYVFDVLDFTDEQTLEYYKFLFGYVKQEIEKGLNNILKDSFLNSKYQVDKAFENLNQPISLSKSKYVSHIYNRPIEYINDEHINNIISKIVETDLPHFEKQKSNVVVLDTDLQNSVYDVISDMVNKIFKRLDGHQERLIVLSCLRFLNFDKEIIYTISRFDKKTKIQEYKSIWNSINLKTANIGIVITAFNVLKNHSCSKKKLPSF